MYRVILLLILAMLATAAGAQTADSAKSAQVEQRLEIVMAYIDAHLELDPSIRDTLAYLKRVYANHIETIRLRTWKEEARRPQYAYALQLHRDRLRKVLPAEDFARYIALFEAEPSGFNFCSVCTHYRARGFHCGFCGEGGP